MNQKQIQTIALTTTTTLMGSLFWLTGSSFNSVALSSDSSNATVSMTSEVTDISSETEAIATIQSYQWKGQKSTILRVNNLPVLMFLSSLDSPESQQNALSNAQKVAHRLNTVAVAGFDANQITVEWNKNTQGYSIKIGNEELIQVNSQVILPDTTNNLANDALQATNRLRRLLGNAVPLTQVTNLPKNQGNQVTIPKSVSQYRVASVRRGVASWYGPGFHGRRTANGERYNQHGLTAAHRHLPFGTKVRVTNLRNNRSVVVRINDRGPFSGGRIIDLSAGAAKQIGVFSSGVAPVKLEILGR